ncbi:hypothetical protein LAZ67_3004787 [Cordylochernes scorpioides]|uniref:RRM domain-containing protein n=1 Tax=Cordylochernes scorpioides TaxID=51811 RepID=A0ABY6KB22_9ARAC|nr:hypothetical protein LAZ67_3004787 [Cordylochernes scorpioides]
MFLGIKIIQDKEGISLQQSHYVQQILQKYGMENCKEVPTPGSKEINLDNHIEDDNCDQHTHQEALGMLMFLAVNTRPDIAYITSKLSQYSRQPKQMHWTAIKRVMRYLRGTIDLGVKFERGKTGILKSYTDASWSTTHDGKSYGGYVLKLSEATIDWKSSKQPLVALSTMEAEMIAACESCCQIKWIINLLRELEDWNFMEKPTAIYTDSQSLIKWISSPKQSSRCRHINRKYHFLRDCYESRDICLLYKPSQDLEADIFTKDLSRDQMKKHLENLSIVEIKTNHKIMVRPTKIFVGSLADGVTNEDVKPLFEKYGKVVECDVLGKYGFVHMERSEDAEKAIAELSGYSLKGQAIRVMQSINSKPPKTKIFVGSLPQDCKGEELRELFEKYGTVTECAVIGIYGFVHMERIDEAQNAIKELNHYKFKGSYLRVESSTGEKRQGGQEYGGPWRGGFGGGRGRPHPYGRPPVGPHPPPPGMRRGPFRDDMFIGRPDEFPQRRPMKPEFPPRPADDLFFRRPGGPVFDRRPDDFISRRQDDYLTRRPSADFAPPRRPEEFPLHSARRDEFPLRRPEEYPPRRIDDYMTPPKPDDFSRRTSDYGIRRQEEYSPRRSDDFQTRSRPEEMRAYRDDLYPRRSMEYPQRSLAPQNGHPDYYRRAY